MKNIHVGLLIISGEWGGAEETVYQLAKHLTKHQIKVSVFINDEINNYFSDISNVSIYTLGSFNNKNIYSFLSGLYNIRHNLIKILKTHPVDLVHAQLEGSLFAYAGLFHKFKIPVIFTLQGAEIRAYYEKKKAYEIAVHYLLKEMLEKAKYITSPSLWQIGIFKNKYQLKTSIIPHGVNVKEFRPIKINEEKNTILYVGRFIGWKGIAALIKVAEELPQYKFKFAGWGPLAKLMTLPNTINLGSKKRDELLRQYNKATICVFPSYYEPFGIVGLEAMACGRPVIATKKGFSEFLDNGKEGIIVDPENTMQLKDAIVKLMNDIKLREVLGMNARKKALKYDWKKIVKKYYVLYKNVVAK